KVYLLEANPNPYLHSTSEFIKGARASGRSYAKTILEIVELARARYAERRRGRQRALGVGRRPPRDAVQTTHRSKLRGSRPEYRRSRSCGAVCRRYTTRARGLGVLSQPLWRSRGRKQMRTSTYTGIIEKEGELYVALCPELDVASQGRTVEEATNNLR